MGTTNKSITKSNLVVASSKVTSFSKIHKTRKLFLLIVFLMMLLQISTCYRVSSSDVFKNHPHYSVLKILILNTNKKIKILQFQF